MSLNVHRCAHSTTARISSIMVRLDPDNAVAPWVCLVAKGDVRPQHLIGTRGYLDWLPPQSDGDTRDRPSRASSVCACAHAHLPKVQWAGRRWVTRSYTFKGRDICVLSGPRMRWW